MITQIDRKYEVVLTFSPINEITGHIFECFDYYLFLKDYFKTCILFLGSIPEEKLKCVFDDKYIDRYDDISDDIIVITEQQLKTTHKLFTFGKDTVVILCDGNIHQLQLYNIQLMTHNLLGFLCAEKEEAYYTANSMYKHITYLKDYRVYKPCNLFKSYDYVKKLPFSHYKKFDKVFDNTGMMYVTYACRKVTPEVIKQYHERSGCTKTLLVVPYKLAEYDVIDDVQQVEAPVDGLFMKFDTYIYTPVQRKFDCSPRLVTECFLHKKNVLVDLPYVDIGLQTRYNDCKKDIEQLNLKENDQIVDIIARSKYAM